MEILASKPELSFLPVVVAILLPQPPRLDMEDCDELRDPSFGDSWYGMYPLLLLLFCPG
jgi:hypothetical protein